MLQGQQWFEHHMHDFVVPYLGRLPMRRDPNKLDFIATKLPQHALAALVACWKRAKQRSGGRTILLAGRDVWEFYILAQLEGFRDVVFRPDISRWSVEYVQENYRDHYLVDTGYNGRIAKKLNMDHWDLISWSGAGYPPPNANRKKREYYFEMVELRREHSLFPYGHHSSALSTLASGLEYVPKYWKAAEYNYSDQKIIQTLVTDKNHFEQAAQVTQHIVDFCLDSRIFPVGRTPLPHSHLVYKILGKDL